MKAEEQYTEVEHVYFDRSQSKASLEEKASREPSNNGANKLVAVLLEGAGLCLIWKAYSTSSMELAFKKPLGLLICGLSLCALGYAAYCHKPDTDLHK